MYVAKVMGAAAFAAIVAYAGPAIGVIKPQIFTGISKGVVNHSPQVILVSGILAGWLMGLCTIGC